MRRIVLGALGLLLVVVIILAMRGRAEPVEMTEAAQRVVREYISEDAKTRLDEEYTLAMPVSGTLERIAFKEGDVVEQGQVIARVKPLGLEQRVRGLEALISQTRAQIDGVDVMKPKSEDLELAAKRVRESSDVERISQEERAMAELEFAEAEKEFSRIRSLYGQRAASQAEYDTAERTFKQLGHGRERASLAEQAARVGKEMAVLSSKRIVGTVDDNEYMRKAYLAEIERLEAELAVAKDDLAKAVVHAPVNGPIMEKYVTDERALPVGTPFMKMGDLASIEIECDVLSEEVGRIQVGNAVEIDGKALLGKSIMGSVTRVFPSGFMKISSLGIQQQRVRTIIAFDNTELNLRPGTSVDVKIITAEHPQALAVPERATFRHNGGWAVFTVRSGRAQLTPVTAGLRNDDWAEILSGVKPGDTVIAEPKNHLADGTRVTAY